MADRVKAHSDQTCQGTLSDFADDLMDERAIHGATIAKFISYRQDN